MVRLGLLLSVLATIVIVVISIWSLIIGPEWRLVILIYVGLYEAAAVAVIWLCVFVVSVIAKAVRVLNDSRRL